MAVEGVVRQLRNLAADPQNREKIVKDQGCLPGLVLFLDNENVTVVTMALEALQYLAESALNRPLMKKELGMIISLESIISKSNYDKRAQNLACSIHKRLSLPPSPSPLKETQNHNRPKTRVHAKHQNKFFLGINKKKWKTILLQIKGLSGLDCRRACEEELLQVKGVISFTFDMIKKRCLLRTKLDMKPEVLVVAIARTETMSAEQVIKNERGEEVILSFGANPAMANKENNSLPDYLPEDDSPIKDKAVRRHGQADQEGGKGGWISTAASFISTNFYW